MQTNRHRPPPASIQRCPHCKKWEPKGALKAHVIRSHPDKANSIAIKGEHLCPLCAEHCTNEASLHAHLSRKHFACFKCHNYWASREELVDHWLSTSHVEYCQSCDGGFSTFQKYNAHLCPRRRAAHTQAPSEPRTCPACRMTAPDEEIFQEHWEKFHADWTDPQQPAHCRDCNMKFKNLGLLTAHHWKEKACTKCHTHHKSVNGLRQVCDWLIEFH